MSNYNLTLQSNNTDLQAILNTINELPEAGSGGTQATPVISVSSNGLITATAGAKTSTHQLAFQAAKTITPSTANQIAVSSGYYTGGNITVKGDANLVAGNIKSGVSIFGVSGTLVEGSMSSGEQVEWSANEDTMVTRAISSYFNDRVEIIGAHAFDKCQSLTTVSFPACTKISYEAFAYCINLTTVSFPSCQKIYDEAFCNCDKLTTVSFPVCTFVGSSAFEWCNNLTNISLPMCSKVEGNVFKSCYNLTTIDLPMCSWVNAGAFLNCSNLTTVNLPQCLNGGASMFQGCSNLATVNIPSMAYGYSNMFYNCINLETISLPNAGVIRSDTFKNCYNLKSLYLTKSRVCTLSNSNAFTSTPIGGYSASAGTYGSIYVPASLLASYKTATNWTYFSSRFVGI